MQVKFRPEALQDIEEIADWYNEQGGKAVALKMIERIECKIPLLENNPYLAPEYKAVPEVRFLTVADGLFIMFYRIKSETVEILHVRRSRQKDWIGLQK